MVVRYCSVVLLDEEDPETSRKEHQAWRRYARSSYSVVFKVDDFPRLIVTVGPAEYPPSFVASGPLKIFLKLPFTVEIER